MRIVRLNRKATKSLRVVRGFCRVAKVGRITRAQAVELALSDLADQIREAREYGYTGDLATIKTHLTALRKESK